METCPDPTDRRSQLLIEMPLLLIEARNLTVPLVQTREELHAPTLGTQNTMVYAHNLSRSFDLYSKLTRNDITENRHDAWSSVIGPETIDEAVDAEDHEALEHLADFSTMWLPDIADAFARRAPIEVNVLEATLTKDTLQTAMSGCLEPEKLGVVGTGIAKAITAVTDYEDLQKLGLTIHDIKDPETGQTFSPIQRARYVTQVYKALRESETIKSKAEPGNEILIRRDSEQIEKIDELIRELRGGQVVAGEDQSLYFIPNQRTVDSLRGVTAEQRQKLAEQGVCLKEIDGTPTPVALRAAGRLLDQRHDAFMNIDIRDTRHKEAQQEEYLLGYGFSLYAFINHQPATINYSQMSEAAAGYIFTKWMQKHSREHVKALEDFAAFTSMTPAEAEAYYLDNYSEMRMPEDKKIIKILTSLLPKIYKGRPITSVLSRGHGAFSYLAEAVSPYLKKGARIVGTDIAVASLSLGTQLKYGAAPPQIAAIGPTFEAELVREGGDIYKDCHQKTLDALDFQHAASKDAILAVLGEKPHVYLRSFYDCSKDWLLSSFFRSIIEDSLQMRSKQGSLMIGLHMLRRRSWGRFPSTYLTPETIKQVYGTAGLEIETFEIESHASTDNKFSGMDLVLAWPKPNMWHMLADGGHLGSILLKDLTLNPARAILSSMDEPSGVDVVS